MPHHVRFSHLVPKSPGPWGNCSAKVEFFKAVYATLMSNWRSASRVSERAAWDALEARSGGRRFGVGLRRMQMYSHRLYKHFFSMSREILVKRAWNLDSDTQKLL